MAHDGTGTGWSETTPADTEAVSDGALELRDLRIAARIRLEKEHVTPAAASVGGEHKAGSAKAYYQASAPTQRPDGATNFTAADYGRLFVDSDDNILYVYTASGFEIIVGALPGVGEVTTAMLADNAVTTVKITDGNVTLAKIGTGIFLANATGRGKFAAGFVDASLLATDAVETAKIKNAAVTAAKIASGVLAKKSAMGTYAGNGSTTGPTVTGLGFVPGYIQIARNDKDSHNISFKSFEVGNPRSITNPNVAAVSGGLDFNADGFQLKSSHNAVNQNGITYAYIAFEE